MTYDGYALGGASSKDADDARSGASSQSLKRAPFSFHSGASWMTLDGTIYIVPGFHEEWIRKHQDIVGPYRTVAEVIENLRWLSIVVYSNGYLEVCINDQYDSEVRQVLWQYLSHNRGRWREVMIMPFHSQGFIQFGAGDVRDATEFTIAMNRVPGWNS